MRYPIKFYKDLTIGQEIYFIKYNRILREIIMKIKITERAKRQTEEKGCTPICEGIECMVEILTHRSMELPLTEHDIICADINELIEELISDYESPRNEHKIS